MTIFPISPQQFLKSNFRSFDLEKTRFSGHSPLRKPAFPGFRLYENPLFRAFAFTKTRFSGLSPLRNLFSGQSPLRKPAFPDIRLYENPLSRTFAFTKTRFSGLSPLRNLFLKRGKPSEGLPLRRTIGFRFDFKAQRYY